VSRYDTVVLDVDGTLLDSNYHHAIAWARAFESVGVTVPVWRIHRHIGMGGDRLVPAYAVLAGGYGRAELEEAGAAAVHDDVADLLAHLDEWCGADPALGERRQ